MYGVEFFSKRLLLGCWGACHNLLPGGASMGLCASHHFTVDVRPRADNPRQVAVMTAGHMNPDVDIAKWLQSLVAAVKTAPAFEHVNLALGPDGVVTTDAEGGATADMRNDFALVIVKCLKKTPPKEYISDTHDVWEHAYEYIPANVVLYDGKLAKTALPHKNAAVTDPHGVLVTETAPATVRGQDHFQVHTGYTTAEPRVLLMTSIAWRDGEVHPLFPKVRHTERFKAAAYMERLLHCVAATAAANGFPTALEVKRCNLEGTDVFLQAATKGVSISTADRQALVQLLVDCFEEHPVPLVRAETRRTVTKKYIREAVVPVPPLTLLE
jgi:hypothetical protein